MFRSPSNFASKSRRQHHHVRCRKGRAARDRGRTRAQWRTLVARIEDNGRQFDPTRAPPPVVATSLEKAKVGDLGIHLMRSFASGMDTNAARAAIG